MDVMAEDSPTTPRGQWSPEALAKVVSDLALTVHGANFDHLMPDPFSSSGWIVVLKDGTTDHMRIGCAR